MRRDEGGEMRCEGDELGSDLDLNPWKKFRIRQNDTQKLP